MKKLSASILGQKNKHELINELIKKGITHIHYDVMDKTFVKGFSLPLGLIKDILKKTKKHIVDIHLMVNNPDENIQRFKSIADYLTFHFETATKEEIESILKKHKDKKIGIAINPSTNVKVLFPFLDSLSHVLIMSVVPGKGGQEFIKKSLDKIKMISDEIKSRKLNVIIQVDGGINNISGPLAISAGANSLVSGTYLIKNLEDKKIVKKITTKIQ